MPEKTVQKEPGKKPAPSKKPKPQQEVVVQIPLSELHPFPDHPFQVREDASMQETAVTELFGFSEQLNELNSESCSKTATLNHLRFQIRFLQ